MSGYQAPNILVFICDQLNPDALSCYGGPVHTPNIDKLAAAGLIVENAVCPAPFCSPSRASLVLGTYPHEHGINQNLMKIDYPGVSKTSPETEEGITNNDITIDRLLYNEGYNTYQFGKWHLSGEKLEYYESNYGEHHEYAEEMAHVFKEVRQKPREEWMDWYGWILPVNQTDVYLNAVNQTSPSFRGNKHSDFITKIGQLQLPVEQTFDVRVADKTINAINNLDKTPFILTCSFNYPHDPNVVPEPYYSMFNPDSLLLPANHDSIDPKFVNSWSERIVRELGGPGVREFLRIYYASVKLIDDQVGRVIKALKSNGKFDNTIIVFTADHGDMMAGHRMIWKSNQSFYDEVVRIPMIIYYPGKIKPGRASFPINLTDIPPTLLAFAGQKVPVHMTGNNLSSFMTGGKDPKEAPQYVLCERMPAHPQHLREMKPGRDGNFMIRGNGWKYAIYKDSTEFLYNLINDPEELNNLGNDPAYQNKKLEMHTELIKLLKQTNYKF